MIGYFDIHAEMLSDFFTEGKDFPKMKCVNGMPEGSKIFKIERIDRSPPVFRFWFTNDPKNEGAIQINPSFQIITPTGLGD